MKKTYILEQIQAKALQLANELWSSGKAINGYTVHRMSYGDYFIQPITWMGGETHGFSKKTRWIETDEMQSMLPSQYIGYTKFIKQFNLNKQNI